MTEPTRPNGKNQSLTSLATWVSKGKVGLAVLGVAAVTAACSAIKLGYNNSAALAHTYLTSSIDFNAEQSAKVRASLDQLIDWHRGNELETLANALLQAKQAVQAKNPPTGLDRSAVSVLTESFENSLVRTAKQASPLIASNLLALYPNQVASIQARLDKSNRDYQRKWMPGQTEDWAAAKADRAAKRFERWFGRLNKAQHEAIAQWARLSDNDQQHAFERRLAQQAEFMRLVKLAANRQINQAALETEVFTLLTNWRNPSDPAEKLNYERRRASTIDLVVEVSRLASTKQLQAAVARADQWAGDFMTLAGG